MTRALTRRAAPLLALVLAVSAMSVDCAGSEPDATNTTELSPSLSPVSEGGTETSSSTLITLPFLSREQEPPPPSDPSPAPTTPPAQATVDDPAEVRAGHYRIRAHVRTASGARVDMLLDDELLASYGVGKAGRDLMAVAYVDGPDQIVGFASNVSIEVGDLRFEPIEPTFTVRGSRVLDLAGADFVPRGANRSGYEFRPDGGSWTNLDAHESSFMRSWGMNFVRIPLNQEYWLANCPVEWSWVHGDHLHPSGRPWTYQELIHEEVRRYTDAGMLVLLDLHLTSRGEPRGCDERLHQTEMPDERSIRFWRHVAGRYGSNALVAFDLFNEPQFVDAKYPPATQEERDHIWRRGGEIVTHRDLLTTRSYQAVGMQRLYNVVRHEMGANNLVFVSGLRYALDVGVMLRAPLDATGIVAAPHVYCLDCSEPGVSVGHERRITGEAAGERERPGASDRFPTVVTEFGHDRPHDAEQNRLAVTWMESEGLGWSVYMWALGGDGKSGSEFGIIRERDGGLGEREPLPAGLGVWEVLASQR